MRRAVKKPGDETGLQVVVNSTIVDRSRWRAFNQLRVFADR